MLKQSPLKNLGKQVNDIHDYLKELESTVEDDRQKYLVRRILSECCDLLTSIDTAILRENILQTLKKADEQTPGWRQQIFNNDHSFNFFLDVEDKLLEKVGFNKSVRERILHEIARVREYAIYQSEKITPSIIIGSIKSLKDEICKMKDQKIIEGQEDKKKKNIKIVVIKAVKTLAITVIVVDVFAPSLFSFVSQDIASASATLGAAVQGAG